MADGRGRSGRAEKLALHVGDERLLKGVNTYGRGSKVPLKDVKDRKLRSKLRSLESRYQDRIAQTQDAEILLENEHGLLETESGLERTYKISQRDIQQDTGLISARSSFNLDLTGLGPYRAEYTRNGRELLLAGRKGHLTTMDWREGKLGCELQLGETIRAAIWLHNNQFFAAAQKKHVYMYDRAGVQVHKMEKHIEVTHMEFLPYHFLLSTIGNAGYLKYSDISTGQLIAELPTKQGSPTAFTQNPYNAVIHTGHQNGTVTLWSPNSTTPLVKLLAHRGPVRSIAVDRGGHYMVTAGQDLRMSVWDIRTFQEVNNYFLRQPGSSIAISDRDLTSVSWGTQMTVWKGLFNKASADQEKIQSPYLSWGGAGKVIENVSWCPFEDVLGIAHDKGFSSIIVPGAGESNFDALEINPFENVKQRQEAEVKGLLNKLQPEMISLMPDYVGGLDSASDAHKQLEKDLDRSPEDLVGKLKNKGRGKNSSLRKYLRKRGTKNILDDRRSRIEELRKAGATAGANRLLQKRERYGASLARFARKETG